MVAAEIGAVGAAGFDSWSDIQFPLPLPISSINKGEWVGVLLAININATFFVVRGRSWGKKEACYNPI